MSLILLWCEALLAIVFLSAGAAAVADRWPWRWRRLVIAIAAMVPVVPSIVLAGVVTWLARNMASTWSLAAPVLLASAATIAASWIIRRTYRDRGWRARRALSMGGVFIVLVVLTSHQVTQTRMVETQAVAARAVLSIIALRQGMPSPGDNAAVDIMALGSRLNFERMQPLVTMHGFQRWEVGEGPKPLGLDGVFTAFSDAMPIIEHALSRSSMVMPRDLNGGWVRASMPEITTSLAMEQLLTTRCRLRAEGNDLAGAWADVQRLLRLGELLGNEPLLFNTLVGGARTASAFKQAQWLAAHGPIALPPPPRAWNWAQRLDQSLICLEGEVLQLAASELFSRPLALAQELNLGWPALCMPFYRLFLFSDDVRNFQDVLFAMRESAKSGFAAVAGRDDEQSLRTRDDRLYFLSRSMLPAFSGTPALLVQVDARRAVLEAARLATEAGRRHGAWPIAPGGDWPLDPCTDRPLRLRAEGGTLRIWSIGTDLKDGGGSDLKHNRGDISIVLAGW